MATKLHYRNLRAVAGGRCPALDKVLELVMIDEAAHAQFFRQLVGIYLDADREAETLEQFRMVANTFSMPADQRLARPAAGRECKGSQDLRRAGVL